MNDRAVPHGAGTESGQIRATTRLGEKLDPQLGAGKDARNVRKLLFGVSEPFQGCAEDVDRDAEIPSRHLITSRFLQNDPLMLECQALPPVLH